VRVLESQDRRQSAAEGLTWIHPLPLASAALASRCLEAESRDRLHMPIEYGRLLGTGVHLRMSVQRCRACPSLAVNCQYLLKLTSAPHRSTH
jgi:hypothetical protein